MIRGRIFSEMIRVSAKNQSDKTKVRVTDEKSELQPARPPESEQDRPEKEPESGLGASTENPLKAFLQNVWGEEEDLPENAPSRKLLDPSKRGSGLVSLRPSFNKRKHAPESRGREAYQMRGGGKHFPSFWQNESFVRLSSPFLSICWTPLCIL